MRTLKSLILSFLVITLFFSSCRNDELLPGDALVYIPETVTSVTAINVSQLMEKADFDALKEMAFYSSFLQKVRKENAAFARILEDPKRAGVDLDHRVYLNVELDKPDVSGMVSLVFSLKDKAAFERALDDLDIAYLPASRDPGYFQKHGTVLLWNEEIGILGMGQEGTIQQQVEAYLTTPEDRSVSQNDNLRDALAGDFDVLNWISSSALVELFQLDQWSKVARYSEKDLRENYLHSYLHFEEGTASATTKYHLQRKLANDLALVFNEQVNTDFRDKLPHDKLFLYANFGLRPKGINQLLIEYHIKGLSDEPFEKLGITTEDVINAFSGDAAIAIYQEDQRQKFNLPSFLSIYGIGSREHLDRILLAAQNADYIYRIGDDHYQVLRSADPDSVQLTSDRVVSEFLIKDDLLYFGEDDSELLKKVAAGDFGTEGHLPEAMRELTRRNAVAVLVDMLWLGQVEDDMADIPVKTIEGTAGRKKAAVTVEMKASGVNSLKQLLQWMDRKYQEEQADTPQDDDNKS